MNPQYLRQLSRTIIQKLGLLETQFGDLSLPPVQVHALIELDNEPCTMAQLAERLKINQSYAVKTQTNLSKQLMVESVTHPEDKNTHLIRLTEKGRAAIHRLNATKNEENQNVLEQMDKDEHAQLEQSLLRYAKALRTAKLQKDYTIRELTEDDNATMADIIRKVSAEYNLTADKGFSVADPTLDQLSNVYNNDQSAYWVIEQDGQILGGAGVAPLSGEEDVCELQKMYFLPELRGKGLSRTLAVKCLDFAREQGLRQCYLETTETLKEAIALYKSLGFETVSEPLGNTGHTDCEVRMLKKL